MEIVSGQIIAGRYPYNNVQELCCRLLW